jgi:hypothetical protein
VLALVRFQPSATLPSSLFPSPGTGASPAAPHRIFLASVNPPSLGNYNSRLSHSLPTTITIQPPNLYLPTLRESWEKEFAITSTLSLHPTTVSGLLSFSGSSCSPNDSPRLTYFSSRGSSLGDFVSASRQCTQLIVVLPLLIHRRRTPFSFALAISMSWKYRAPTVPPREHSFSLPSAYRLRPVQPH